MKYYLIYDKSGTIIGSSRLYQSCEAFDCKECSQEEFIAFEAKRKEEKIAKLKKEQQINEKKVRLEELTKDLAQVQAGLVIDNIEEKKAEFRTLLNEVRVLQGKEPRKEG